MRIARLSVIGFIALVGCKPSMKGRLELDADGQKIAMKSAFYVPKGTESLRVHISSSKHDCAWAERQGLGFMDFGETSGSLDFAPVIDSAGASHWRVVGAGWNGRATQGNVGAVAWPADVTNGAGCGRHIKVDSDTDKHVRLHGDFDVICCGAEPKLPTPPATVVVGGKTFPLAVASAKQLPDKTWSVRVSHDLPQCSDDATGADLFVDFYADASFTTPTSFHVQGNVLPAFGYEGMRDAMPKITRSGETLAIEGVIQTRELGAFDGPTLDFQMHGTVALTACPGPH